MTGVREMAQRMGIWTHVCTFSPSNKSEIFLNDQEYVINDSMKE